MTTETRANLGGIAWAVLRDGSITAVTLEDFVSIPAGELVALCFSLEAARSAVSAERRGAVRS